MIVHPKNYKIQSKYIKRQKHGQHFRQSTQIAFIRSFRNAYGKVNMKILIPYYMKLTVNSKYKM